MRKALTLTFVTLSLFALSACKASLADPNAGTQNPPASEADFTQTEIGFVTEWAKGISWQGPQNGTNNDPIIIDAQHTIGAHMIQTTFATALFTDGDFQRVFMDSLSRNTLDAAAQERGWEIMPSMDAEGSGGARLAYSRTTDEGTSFLVIMALGVDCRSEGGTPVGCLNYAGTISVTSALPKDADL